MFLYYTAVSKGYMTFGSVPVCSAVYHTENFQFVSVSVVELSFHTCCESQCSQSVFMGGISTLLCKEVMFSQAGMLC